MEQKRTIVVALGGNALQRQGEASSGAQQKVADETVKQLLPLIKAGHNVAIVHGNGPQVGNIVLHEEAINTPDVPTLPLEDSGAMSQGLVGFWLQQAFHDAFAINGMSKHTASVVTQTVVNADDPAFDDPTKPIGRFYTEQEAQQMASERGFTVKEDAGRGWRRIVPSPKPQDIVESAVIRSLALAGVVVISTGGGGIPVLRAEDGTLSGVEAVIDKDFGAAKLAGILGADTLLIVTSVEAAKINFNTPDEQSLAEVSVDELDQYIDSGQFAPGSMLPKVQASIEFVSGTPGRTAIITSLEKTAEAIEGVAGTRIIAKP